MQITSSPLTDHPLEAPFQAVIADEASPTPWRAAGQMMVDLVHYLREQIALPTTFRPGTWGMASAAHAVS